MKRIERRLDYDFNRLCKERNRARGGIRILYLIKRLIETAIKKQNRKISQIDAELSEIKSADYKINDHSILRYMERAEGFDVKAVMARMNLDDIVEEGAGKSEFNVVRGKLEFVFHDYTLVTVKKLGGR